MTEDCANLGSTGADPGVLCQEDPSSVAHDRKPVLVLGSLRKVVIVKLDPETGSTQRLPNRLPAQAGIEEVGGRIRLRP